MTLPDFPDWAQPSSQIEFVASLPNMPRLIHNGQTLGAFDVSAWRTLSVELLLPNPGTVQRYALLAQWAESATLTGSDALTYHSRTAYATQGVAILGWQLPVRAQSVSFILYGTDVTDTTVYLYGSTRDLVGGRPRVSNDQLTRTLANANLGSIAAGATAPTFYVPPSTERVLLSSNQKIAPVQFLIDAPSPVAGVVTNRRIANIFGTDVALQGEPIYAPGLALEVNVFNSDTAAHSTTLNITDVS